MAKKLNYLAVIRIPLFILVAWSVASLIVAIISFSLFANIFSTWPNWILTLAVFVFLGYITGPLFNAVVGAVIAWITSLVVKG